MKKSTLWILIAVVAIGAVIFVSNKPQQPAEEVINQPVTPAEQAEPITPTPTPTQGGSAGTPGKANALTVKDQTPGANVVIESATLDRAGFVVIHEDNRGSVGRVLAMSNYLPAGTSKNINIILATAPGSGYFAMLHADIDGDKNFSQNIDVALNDAAGKPVAVEFYANAATTTSGKTIVVHMKNFAFDPISITINRGDLVTFINDDSSVHTATANIFGGSHSITTGKSYTFDSKNTAAGTYSYTCDLHPGMKGTIIIK